MLRTIPNSRFLLLKFKQTSSSLSSGDNSDHRLKRCPAPQQRAPPPTQPDALLAFAAKERDLLAAFLPQREGDASPEEGDKPLDEATTTTTMETVNLILLRLLHQQVQAEALQQQQASPMQRKAPMETDHLLLLLLHPPVQAEALQQQ